MAEQRTGALGAGGLNRGAEALILANPLCLGRRGISLGELEALMADAGLQATALPLGENDDPAEWRQRIHASQANMVIAAGGDGSIHTVANLIAPLGIPLGILPIGTANDFARSLSLPAGLREAAAVIADEPPLAVDLGKVNGHLFLNAAHLGLGVETAKRTNARLKDWIGPIAYVLAAAQAYWHLEPFDLEVCLARECLKLKASQLIVGNGRYFGGGALIAPEASLDDGLLDVHVLGDSFGPTEAIKLAAAFRLGTLGEQAAIFHFRTPWLTASLQGPVELNADGELLRLEAPLRFEVVPRALSVYAPSSAMESAWDPTSLATGIS